MNTETSQNQESIYCGKCGTKNPAKNNFCNQCGNRIQITGETSLEKDNSNLKAKEEHTQSESAKSSTIYAIVGIATILTILTLWYLNTHSSNSKLSVHVNWVSTDESTKKEVYQASEEFVKRKLKYPNTAAFPTTYISVKTDDQSIYTVISYVDGLNAYERPVRINYRIKMQYLGGDMKDAQDWKVIETYLDEEN
jgi:uncharacterized membrane protein YvbJ